ncbi:MAG: methyl-accepting chemotaxis protein [Candidatus Kryptoniota bacterium]
MTSKGYLSAMSLQKKFLFMLGGIIVLGWGLFFYYSQYSMNIAQKEFEQRATLLAQTIGANSKYGMMMGDAGGLSDNLKNIMADGDAIAGGFFDQNGKPIAQLGLDSLYWNNSNVKASAGTVQIASTKDGRPVLIAVSKIENKATNQMLGYVVAAVPAQALQSLKTNALVLLAITVLLFLAFGYAALTFINRTIVKPVNILKDAAERVAAGDFEARVSINQTDEVGYLSTAFNIMVENNKKVLDEVNAQRKEAEEARKLSEQMQMASQQQQEYLQREFARISDVIEAVTAGDLTRQLDIERDDEVGTLMKKINQMVNDLGKLISEVHIAGNSLGEASEQISSAAEEMSSGSSEQANQTNEVATAMEQMSRTIIESSKNATDAAEMARKAAQLANEGEKVFQETIGGMTKIAQIVNKSAETVDKLGKSSAQIGEIIQVIDDIADQTNLLALNAAIEAARAGEQGRGFAVVADEVRKLAERTTSATKEIAAMIKRIQSETTQVVTAMTEGNIEAENGMKLADRAADSLSEIIRSVNSVMSMINQIAAASQEQSSASEQISHNVESISTVAKQVSNAAADMAKTAETLNSLTAHLRSLIERFNTGSTPQIRSTYEVRANGKIVPSSKANGNGIPRR